MKKVSLYLAAVASLMAVSCVKADFSETNTQPQRNLVPLVLNSGEKMDEPQAKTSLNGNEVHWTSDDVIAVVDKANSVNEFEAVSTEGSKAVFEGFVESGTTDFYAVYPYSSVVSADASNLTIKLPSTQNPKVGTFAEELNISVASGQKTPGNPEVSGLKFHNLCGLIAFTIPERLQEVSQVTFTANNRVLAGNLSVSKSDMLTVASVASGSQSLTMSGSFSAGSTFYFVAVPGDISGFSIQVTTKNGATFTRTSVKTISVAAGALKYIGTIDFKSEPSAVAEHTYENGVLTGTRIALNLGMPDMMGEYVTDLNATLVDADKRQYRAISSKSNVSGVVNMAVRNGAVYVPKGDYTLTYSYKMNGVLEEKTLNVTVPAPEFTVSAFAETSYSRYINNDATANTYFSTPYEVKNIAYSVSISDEVLEQFGLSECSGAVTAVSGGAKYASTDESASVNMNKSAFYSNPGVTNVPIGEYSVSASATFDGVSKSSPTSTIYITGLPYKAPTMVESDWKFASGESFYSNGVIQLGGEPSGVFDRLVTSTMLFHIPKEIPVVVNANVTVRDKKWGLIWTETTFTIAVNGTTVISQKGNRTEKNYSLSGDGTFTPSQSKITMDSSYDASGPWCKVYSMYVLYKF